MSYILFWFLRHEIARLRIFLFYYFASMKFNALYEREINHESLILLTSKNLKIMIGILDMLPVCNCFCHCCHCHNCMFPACKGSYKIRSHLDNYLLFDLTLGWLTWAPWYYLLVVGLYFDIDFHRVCFFVSLFVSVPQHILRTVI